MQHLYQLLCKNMLIAFVLVSSFGDFRLPTDDFRLGAKRPYKSSFPRKDPAMNPSLLPTPRQIVYPGGTTVLSQDLPVALRETPGMAEEEYELRIQKGAAVVAASSQAGFFYGRATLEQIKATCAVCDDLILRDRPVLPYRGFLIDSCRHFYGADELKRLIDAAARCKLNKFHWHLTDDQGWRIEIKKYPLLTEVGSRRSDSRFGGVVEGRPHEGYFTREQVREIVAYCAERQIEVIPEIEMPGHFTAAIAAYPFLGCTGEPMEPEQKEGIFPNVLCVGSDRAVAFVKDVLEEVCGLFPGRYIHVGGDEAPRARWRECPACAARMRALGLEDYDRLQGQFIKEIAEFLRQRGKTAVTWNESLKGGLLSPGDALVQRWMDRKDLCRDFAAKGGQLIESDFYRYYFDYPYGMTPLKKAFAHDPFAPAGDPQAVYGVEGCLWTEFVRDFDDLCQKLFPRLLAVAERGWSGYPTVSYADFAARAEALAPYFSALGVALPPPDKWDPRPPARLKQLAAFFKGPLAGFLKDRKQGTGQATR